MVMLRSFSATSRSFWLEQLVKRNKLIITVDYHCDKLIISTIYTVVNFTINFAYTQPIKSIIARLAGCTIVIINIEHTNSNFDVSCLLFDPRCIYT